MGKSPAKWIKTLLLWKKSSNSNLPKGKDMLNCAHKGEVLASKVTLSELLADPPSISAPILISASNFEDSKKGIPTQLPKSGTNSSSSQAVGNDNAISNFGKPEDPERIRLDRAAAKAQAAFRGYLACGAFQTLKGIIRLQALIRGHLVRRQAVSTLCCTWGIVKFQALARGQKGSKTSDPFRISAFSRVKNSTNKVFVQKLLASSPSVFPLRLQYGPEEPNSLWQWLRRWTFSRFWEPSSQIIRSLILKSQTKRSVWKVSNAKVENGACFTSEHEKLKCGVSKVSGNSTADTVPEHPQNELEKVKRTLKRLTTKEVSKKSEVVRDKTTQTLTRTTDASDVSEQESDEKMMRDVSTLLSNPSKLQADMILSQEDTSLDEPSVSPAVDLAPAENDAKIENMPVPEESSSKDEKIGGMSSKKLNQWRASFPAKTGNLEEIGLNKTPKVPSYMSPTESVKARLRSQGSPRSGAWEVVDKNGLNRRYSLSSSTNSNLGSLSPRAQRQAHVAGKGDKVVRAEWRR
ncbi:protein IQ-DOMAIN 31-like [Hibiscus syriacus]|uniref:protein IQ-DOMAIN 31-like n=1 Tax=Hibiscus syriacus TaxID=106335 RepID=UPI00192183E3|nr:protein IQ-DOMAIN 31-like [Hibiscus syriacus]XP_039046994.1 protein IQ-DOMAIN 31-like [Hibiscus syriacus]XP_039046995.1 protein IQ-DOMAIN 31-like [Hibiscus syriacus]